MLKTLQEGESVQNPGRVKMFAIAVSAIIPSLLGVYAAVYSALSDRYDFAVTVDEAGLIASAVLGLVCSVSTVISSDKVGFQTPQYRQAGIAEVDADQAFSKAHPGRRWDDVK